MGSMAAPALLTAVVGNLDPRARDQSTHYPRGRTCLQGSRARLEADRAISGFSRTQKLATAPVDLNALITGMSELVNKTLGAETCVKTELSNGCRMHVRADANQLCLEGPKTF